jgi:hypothetical protein
MIFNLLRTTLQINGYLSELQYPKVRMGAYIFASIFAGLWLSGSDHAAELPILTLTAILFGFTINAVVMLGNSSEHYLSADSDHSEQQTTYYQKSLHVSIHTLGIGILTILSAGLFQLFPELAPTVEKQLFNQIITINVGGAVVYSLTVYYLIVFSVVIASVAELVKIRV